MVIEMFVTFPMTSQSRYKNGSFARYFNNYAENGMFVCGVLDQFV